MNDIKNNEYKELESNAPFWSEENQARLRLSMQHAKEGKLIKHDLSEVMFDSCYHK